VAKYFTSSTRGSFHIEMGGAPGESGKSSPTSSNQAFCFLPLSVSLPRLYCGGARERLRPRLKSAVERRRPHLVSPS
jgi:hypothetical protein